MIVKKRRLISVMLAGLMTAGVAAMAGCSDDPYQYGENNKNKDVYIAIELKGEKSAQRGL